MYLTLSTLALAEEFSGLPGAMGQFVEMWKAGVRLACSLTVVVVGALGCDSDGSCTELLWKVEAHALLLLLFLLLLVRAAILRGFSSALIRLLRYGCDTEPSLVWWFWFCGLEGASGGGGGGDTSISMEADSLRLFM